jgi:hypothetical protein
VISEETRERWKTRINTLHRLYNEGKITLKPWETEFLGSIEQSFVTHGVDLTPRQSGVLAVLYGRIP